MASGDFLELGPQAVASGLPLKKEFAVAACAANEGKTQKIESLRFSKPALRPVVGREAGVLEDGVRTVSDTGTGQGSVISPLLANVYLHYVFDLWANRWRHREATGNVIIVRYADDFIVGFEREGDARRFWTAVRNRLEEFSLSLHPDKTRLIQFGRAERRECPTIGRNCVVCEKAGKHLLQPFSLLGNWLMPPLSHLLFQIRCFRKRTSHC